MKSAGDEPVCQNGRQDLNERVGQPIPSFQINSPVYRSDRVSATVGAESTVLDAGPISAWDENAGNVDGAFGNGK